MMARDILLKMPENMESTITVSEGFHYFRYGHNDGDLDLWWSIRNLPVKLSGKKIQDHLYRNGSLELTGLKFNLGNTSSFNGIGSRIKPVSRGNQN